MKNYPLTIQKHAGFNVLRGDLYPGGVKCRVLTELFTEQIEENEIVYSGCYFGHSGFALGLAGLLTGKKISLFLPAPVHTTYIQQQVLSLNNVRCRVVEASHQDQVFETARDYATQSNAKLLPTGLNFPAFHQRYIELIRSVCEPPEEVWASGGSGLSARALQAAWPNSRVNVVDLNVRANSDFGSPAKVWKIPESLSVEAELPPPWPSAKYYDAKVWRIAREYAAQGALIWGIA